MKRIIRFIIVLACGMALFTHVKAQERSGMITPTYKFEFKLASQGDTVTTLYCVLRAVDISGFVKICVTYNDKTRIYYTQNLLKEKSREFFIENGLVYIKINEQLDDPFVIIEGEDRMGRKRVFNEKNAKDKSINSRQERENWKKSMARIDSMDYVRQYDNVYMGNDGKPRFKNKQGEVFIIEKDHIRHEHN